MNGIVAHPNFNWQNGPAVNADNHPDFWDAEQCGRQAVTVAWYHEHGVDKPAYYWNRYAYETGMDPWQSIDGVDPYIHSDVSDIWFESGRNITVDNTSHIFVQKRDFPELFAS